MLTFFRFKLIIGFSLCLKVLLLCCSRKELVFLSIIRMCSSQCMVFIHSFTYRIMYNRTSHGDNFDSRLKSIIVIKCPY